MSAIRAFVDNLLIITYTWLKPGLPEELERIQEISTHGLVVLELTHSLIRR